MKAIIRAGLRERRWSIFWWSAGIGVYIALNLLVYPTVHDQAQSLNKVIDQLPHGAKVLLSSNSDILSPVGYLDAKLYHLFLPLLLGALAISLGHSLVQREEQAGTLELLLSRPVSRTKLLLSKLFVGAFVLLGVAAILFVLTLLCDKAGQLGVSAVHVGMATLYTAIFSLLIGSISFALSVGWRWTRKASVGIAVLVALGGFVAESLQTYGDWLKWVAKFLPYHYYHSIAPLQGNYPWLNMCGMVAATVIILMFGFAGFRRRDIGQ